MDLIEFNLEGTSPLLQSSPLSTMRPSGGPERLGRKVIPTPDDEAEMRVYRTPAGVIAHPTVAFRACVLSAAKGRRIGKIAATTIVKGALFVADEWTSLRLPDGQPLEKWDVDLRRVVQQRQGIMRGRPRFEEWAGTVHFEHDPEFIPAAHVRELLEIGGRTVGVGDYRPERGGPFGRFKVL